MTTEIGADAQPSLGGQTDSAGTGETVPDAMGPERDRAACESLSVRLKVNSLRLGTTHCGRKTRRPAPVRTIYARGPWQLLRGKAGLRIDNEVHSFSVADAYEWVGDMGYLALTCTPPPCR